jgi:3-hydroxymyristoyl/3-hydroxydecanoyl-(acyl carrier protein) dehydratase
VDIRVQDGLLEVRSPFLPEPTAWVRTGDRAAYVSPQHFHLRGRADQIVKLSEKRLSLTAMESQLLRHEAVEEVRVILLPSQSQDERSRLAAVIVPSQQGQRWLEEAGTFALISKLRNYLVHDFELVTLPRLWRFPEALPSNAQGKVTLEHLVALFQEPPPDQPTDPILLAQEDTDTGRILHCRVPENLYYLSGHFPQVAVVPGVCQLRWVLQSIETYAGHALQMTAMEAVKFHHMLFPGQAFSLAIRFDGAASTWFYRIFSDEQTFASGRLRVTP